MAVLSATIQGLRQAAGGESQAPHFQSTRHVLHIVRPSSLFNSTATANARGPSWTLAAPPAVDACSGCVLRTRPQHGHLASQVVSRVTTGRCGGSSSIHWTKGSVAHRTLATRAAIEWDFDFVVHVGRNHSAEASMARLAAGTLSHQQAPFSRRLGETGPLGELPSVPTRPPAAASGPTGHGAGGSRSAAVRSPPQPPHFVPQTHNSNAACRSSYAMKKAYAC